MPKDLRRNLRRWNLTSGVETATCGLETDTSGIETSETPALKLTSGVEWRFQCLSPALKTLWE